MDQSKVEYSFGSPTDFERLVVLSILHFLVSDVGICDQESTCNQMEVVSFIFHSILSLANALCVQLPLFQRSLDKVSTMII